MKTFERMIQNNSTLQEIGAFILLVLLAGCFWGLWELNVLVVHFFD